MPSIPTAKTATICQTQGCGKTVRARGFCVACYYRLLRHGDIQPKSRSLKWKHRLSEINEKEKTAICAECGLVKIHPRGNGLWRCAADSNKRSRLYKRAYRESKKAVLAPVCEICGNSEKLCWDHDHRSGIFRGTLCSKCNSAIGMFQDNPTFLRKAAEYLEKDKTDEPC